MTRPRVVSNAEACRAAFDPRTAARRSSRAPAAAPPQGSPASARSGLILPSVGADRRRPEKDRPRGRARADEVGGADHVAIDPWARSPAVFASRKARSRSVSATIRPPVRLISKSAPSSRSSSATERSNRAAAAGSGPPGRRLPRPARHGRTRAAGHAGCRHCRRRRGYSAARDRARGRPWPARARIQRGPQARDAGPDHDDLGRCGAERGEVGRARCHSGSRLRLWPPHSGFSQRQRRERHRPQRHLRGGAGALGRGAHEARRAGPQ